MTIKAKWEKLHLGTSNIYTWVFVSGKMFVIGGTESQKFNLDKIKATVIKENIPAGEEKRGKL